MHKKAQQEMVGFVLIVIVVVIALLVFMIFKMSQPAKVYKSVSADNIIQSIMETTSECQTSFTSKKDSIGDLFEKCYDNKRCSNTNRMACEVLNETLTVILEQILETDNRISAYELNAYYYYRDEQQTQLMLINGSCLGSIYGSDPYIISLGRDEGLSIDLKLCMTD